MSRARSAPCVSLMLVAVLLASCEARVTPPTDPLDLDRLFAPATAAETAAIEAEWAARDVAAVDVVEEASFPVTMAGGPGTARVFSHTIDGDRHYGAVVVPDGAAPRSLPVVVFAHSGDAGINVGVLLNRLTLMGAGSRQFAYVVPSFRSEVLGVGGMSYRSEGESSPLNRDVDDSLALLEVALAHVPEANPHRIGAFGTSRGATVALLMGIREPRIQVVTEMAGPTDFLSSWMRDITSKALMDMPSPLPGFAVFDMRYIQMLATGGITPAMFRLELVRRSPALWPDRLPPVQVHHGTADTAVPLAQAESLITALRRRDRSAHMDEFHLYPGFGHSTVEFSNPAALQFLNRLHR